MQPAEHRPGLTATMHPEYAVFAATAARMMDDELCAAIDVADAEPAAFRLNAEQREAFVWAMSAEVVRRLERCPAA